MSSSGPGAGSAQTLENQDLPYRAYHFQLEIDGHRKASFTECSGMEVSVETIRYRTGGTGHTVLSLPGRVAYGDVTLRYGLTQDPELWVWFSTAVQGRVVRKNVSILLTDSAGKELMRWNLIRAWPNRWRGALLDATTSEVAIESVTLAFDELKGDDERKGSANS
ncbi:MAG TPA: phage tail protein [Ktedonobacterales bacterium]|nr:phage tail protein [Ktedonobacterales bacterium]